MTQLDRFKFIEVGRKRVGGETETAQIYRVNALCSLWWFGKFILNRTGPKGLNYEFHLPLCQQMQKVNFKDLFRISRGHLKSTIASEMLPMWRTLRVTQDDIDYILKLRGADERYLYDDDFIRYLQAIHRPDGTWILCSERKELAVGLLKRTKNHYEQNQTFRWIFNDLLPYKVFPYSGRLKSDWGSHQLTIQRDDLTISEPTFQAQGMNQALQSKHVSGGIIEDDVTGRRCMNSLPETLKNIENHTLLGGLFSDEDRDHTGNQLLVGNDWNLSDINHHVIENEEWFTVHTSGCLWCPVCKLNTRIDMSSFKSFDTTHELLCEAGHQTRPVFPEMYSLKKIHQEWKQMKSNGREVNFCCQYLNQPGATSDTIFQTGWLKDYWFLNKNGLPTEIGSFDGFVQFKNEIGLKQRKAIRDMNRYMILDPSYGATSLAACRAGLPVTAVDDEGRVFLLEDWEKKCDINIVFDAANMFSEKWHIDVMYVEAFGAGRLVGDSFNRINRLSHKPLYAVPIAPDGELPGFVQGSQTPINEQKLARIYNLQPTFEGRFYSRPDQVKFRDAHRNFSIPLPAGVYVDLLDALSYGVQLWEAPCSPEDMRALQAHQMAYLMSAEMGMQYR